MGLQIFLLCSKYGLVHHLELYKGKHETAVIPDHKLGKSSAVVVRLLQHIKKRVNHKVLFDNWFSSPDLLNHLSSEGFQALCTVRLCRVPGLFMASDADLKKRGAYDVKASSTKDSTIHAIKWFDSKSVLLLSSYVGVEPVSQIKRFDNKSKKVIDVSCLAAVLAYNQGIGFVDENNKYMALSRTTIRCTMRCNMRVFFMSLMKWW